MLASKIAGPNTFMYSPMVLIFSLRNNRPNSFQAILTSLSDGEYLNHLNHSEVEITSLNSHSAGI